MSAYWTCNCRHPNTKVYYADEIDRLKAENKELRIWYDVRTENDRIWAEVAGEAKFCPEIKRLRAALKRFDDFLTAKLPDGTSWWSMTPIEVLHEWIKAREVLSGSR